MLGDVARIAGKAEKVKLAEMPPFRIICKSSEGRLEEGEQFGVEALVFLQSSARFKTDYRAVGVKLILRVHRGRVGRYYKVPIALRWKTLELRDL